MRPWTQLGFPLLPYSSGRCSQAKRYGDHSYFICFLSYMDHSSVLLVPQCLKIIVSHMLSTFLVAYGGRGNLVTSPLLEFEMKIATIIFYLKYCKVL